jgi:uncharacterized protein (DUF1697 family)
MKYVALLRGINVGGNSIIKMADLKKAVEESGFTNVSTYIQSGNVLFESSETSLEKIADKLEHCLLNTFKIAVRVVILSHPQFKKVLTDVPSAWKTHEDIRKYIAFVKPPVSADAIAPQIQVKEGVDFLQAGQGALYMSTLLSGITKSGFTKLAGKPFYKDITIRNYNTSQKILAKMEQG